MNDFIERFKNLKTPEQEERFFIELNARIEANAYFTDQLKKQHHIWNKETNDLCTIRDLFLEKRKEKKP